MRIRSYRDLHAWNAAMELACTAYELADRLPPAERFGLATQIRRAAVSVPSNVAEGHGSGLRRRYRHHTHIALGSLAELGTQFEIAKRRGYFNADSLSPLDRQLERTGKLLHGVLRSLRAELLAGGTGVIVAVLACWALLG